MIRQTVVFEKKKRSADRSFDLGAGDVFSMASLAVLRRELFRARLTPDLAQLSAWTVVRFKSHDMPSEHVIEGVSYPTDTKTNVSPKIISLMDRKLHLKDRHPLNFIQR